jgi:hypothetical protein
VLSGDEPARHARFTNFRVECRNIRGVLAALTGSFVEVARKVGLEFRNWLSVYSSRSCGGPSGAAFYVRNSRHMKQRCVLEF